MKFATFDNRKPQSSIVTEMRIGIETMESTIEATVVDYLINQLKAIIVNQCDASYISNQFSLHGKTGCWKRCNLLIIGGDYFFKFIQFNLL
ncbi:unnamed protein product [Wuchereria bancrofti]|uniref:Uncharacterized protein n=1 Tax=Wuchereria bancrofti TaxID=6293 RepID=A0A3P7EDC3_WUCBA|nr:unnamed protein product [Wuchereria bancrofti]